MPAIAMAGEKPRAADALVRNGIRAFRYVDKDTGQPLTDKGAIFLAADNTAVYGVIDDEGGLKFLFIISSAFDRPALIDACSAL